MKDGFVEETAPFKTLAFKNTNPLRWRKPRMITSLTNKDWRRGFARHQKATVFQYLKGFVKVQHCTASSSPYIRLHQIGLPALMKATMTKLIIRLQ
jgi:hypothetical protein